MASNESTSQSDFLTADISGKLLVIAVIFICLETIFVSARFFSQRLGGVTYDLYDWLVVPSYLFCMAINAIMIASIYHAGVGRHLIPITLEDPSKPLTWLKLLFPLPVLYSIAVTLPKLVIIGIYLRIFTSAWSRILCRTLQVTLVLTSLVITVTVFVQCRPIAAFWDFSIDGDCIDILTFWRWASLPNIITDFIMLPLPIPVVWRLQTSFRIKIGLLLTFLTGSLGLIVSILRFKIYFHEEDLLDSTWVGVELGIWTIVEPGVYLIAACLPCLRPLLRRIWTSSKSQISGQITMTASQSASKSATKTMGSRLDRYWPKAPSVSTQACDTERMIPRLDFGMETDTKDLSSSRWGSI